MKPALDVFSAVLLGLAVFLYHRGNELLGDLELERDALNNSRHADQEGLIFNRVPKVGSETIWSLLDKLSSVNNFSSYSDSAEVKNNRGGENNYLRTKQARQSYVDIFVHNCTKPYTYTKHLNFIDLEEFGLTNPVYINFVRHPVERVISWYYYKRTPWHLLKWDKLNRTIMSDNIPPLRELKMNYEDCYESRYHECVYEPGQPVFGGWHGGSHFSQIAFFCGHDEECTRFEDRRALERAKENVAKHYAVVGVLEQFDRSLEVLEGYVPRFFEGARRVYKEMMRGRHVNRNMYKPKTPGRIRRELVRNFTMEIEFYEFCKDRLDKQYLALGL